VWPISVQRSSLCAAYSDGSTTTGEVEVDAGQAVGLRVQRVWLEPAATIHPAADRAIREFDAITIGPGSFYTSLMPIFQVEGVKEALAAVPGPVIFIANLLTEGRGMRGFTAADAVDAIGEAIGRPVDVLVYNTGLPGVDVIDRYSVEHKEPLPLGTLPSACELVSGEFWQRDIARHDRRRLAYAIWSVLSRRLA
ncbi:MAG: 2-phospho-L-lactate transferase CofD family protein, partial [Vicinamibacterales bacterium]